MPAQQRFDAGQPAVAQAELGLVVQLQPVVAQRLAATSGVPNTSLFVQLEFNDFGSLGSSPLGLLRRSIPGYGKTNELSGGGSLLTPP